MPVIWTKLYGQGRVAYTSLGHVENVVRQAELRGSSFCASRKASTATGELRSGQFGCVFIARSMKEILEYKQILDDRLSEKQVG